jgi:hypothetical protein
MAAAEGTAFDVSREHEAQLRDASLSDGSLARTSMSILGITFSAVPLLGLVLAPNGDRGDSCQQEIA